MWRVHFFVLDISVILSTQRGEQLQTAGGQMQLLTMAIFDPTKEPFIATSVEMDV